MLKVIFFDAAGTLFRLPRGVGWHYRAVAERHGCAIDGDTLQRAFGAVWKAMPSRAACLGPRVVLGHADIDEVPVEGAAAQAAAKESRDHFALERDRTIGGYQVE